MVATRRNAKLDKDKDGQMKMVDSKEQKSKYTKDNGQKDMGNEDANGNEEKKRPNPDQENKDEPPNKAVKINDAEPEPIENKTLSPGKEDSTGDEEGNFKVLEQGLLYFFYRPKVQSADDVETSGKAATSIDDVQSTHLLLVPAKSDSENAPPTNKHENGENDQNNYSGTSGEKARKEGVGFRLIRLGKKRMPAPEEAIKKGLQPGGIGGDASEAIWSVVSDIGSRPAGRGRYAIVFHELQPPSRSNVRLTYALSHPTEIGDVQTELGIALSGSVRLSMRNPTLPQTGQGAPPAGLPEEDRVEMNKDELKEAFGGKTDEGGTRYTDPDQIKWLNREGVELLMNRERNQSKEAGAHTGASEEQAKALEGTAKEEGERMKMDDVMNELHLSSKTNPADAFDGTWI
ncbi:uncharacterized protein FA14DRAFT_143731 [Meira miltonrushii]|uniref:Uncharacterized protein n=1 Tax=Meira miltonrushii TaxID=1280837 RepID=A0A316VLW4_9BASI|nr:uncharacterized protein FA14DRAFT_143731 [Meira miltonrushii]PWN38619.1 hypothetical protein FA14DRAFT_143731 [Meira miltonrushii]